MSATEVLSTCTMQLGDGTFCERTADLRFPNRICANHAIRVHLAVTEYLDQLSDEQLAALARGH